jgi:hypothetical protein
MLKDHMYTILCQSADHLQTSIFVTDPFVEVHPVVTPATVDAAQLRLQIPPAVRETDAAGTCSEVAIPLPEKSAVVVREAVVQINGGSAVTVAGVRAVGD